MTNKAKKKVKKYAAAKGKKRRLSSKRKEELIQNFLEILKEVGIATAMALLTGALDVLSKKQTKGKRK